jgi:hypothetical protein
MGILPFAFLQGNAGGSIFVGRRLSPQLSLEGFYNVELATNTYRIGGGAVCSGTTAYSVRGERLGARLYFQVLPRDLHPRALDFLVGASLGGGLIVEEKRSLLPVGYPCHWAGANERNGAVVVTLSTALDVHATRWFTIRFAIELGGIVSSAAGLVVGTTVGPIVRF